MAIFNSVPEKPVSPKPGAGFPWRAAGAIVVAVGALVGVHVGGDRTGRWPGRWTGKGWDPKAFAAAWTFHWPQPPKSAVPVTVAGGAGTGTATNGGPAVISAVMVDDRLALDPFYAALWELEQKKAGGGAPDVVTVLHYGDSPTTADMITADTRAQLQQRFGNAGWGFNLAAKPWAWYGHRNVEMSDTGWASAQKDATGVGRYKQGTYGLGGAVFAGSAGAKTTYTLSGEAQTAVVVHFLKMPGGGSFNVSAGDAPLVSVNTGADAAELGTSEVALPEGTKKVTVAVTAGAVKVFGVDFRTGGSGVVYDSLGLNGATTTVLSRTMEPGLFKASLEAAHPQLVVINYGTNESQFAGLVSTLEKELQGAIANVRAAAPGVPILIMSPMDRGDRQGSDIGTNAEIPKIVAIQKKVAAETGCAFFDTYDAMGGEGTVGRWYAAQPRLMTADLIHPTPQGAVLVANLLVENLYAGYDRWKRAHGISAGATSLKGAPVVNAGKAKGAADAGAAEKGPMKAKPSAMHQDDAAPAPDAPAAATPDAPVAPKPDAPKPEAPATAPAAAVPNGSDGRPK